MSSPPSDQYALAATNSTKDREERKWRGNFYSIAGILVGSSMVFLARAILWDDPILGMATSVLLYSTPIFILIGLLEEFLSLDLYPIITLTACLVSVILLLDLLIALLTSTFAFTNSGSEKLSRLLIASLGFSCYLSVIAYLYWPLKYPRGALNPGRAFSPGVGTLAELRASVINFAAYPNTLMRTLGRPPVPPGYRRIEWICVSSSNCQIYRYSRTGRFYY